MAITVEKVVRVFSYNGVKLPDPSPEMAVDQVKDLYSATYPELNNCSVEGPEANAANDELVYKFNRAVGTKG